MIARPSAGLSLLPPTLRSLFLFCLCLLARLSLASSLPPLPSAAWIPVYATVNGRTVTDPHANTWPSDRCNHKVIPISAEMARALAPNYNGTWREGVDPANPEWTAGIAMTLGGITWGGVVPFDVWLVQTYTSEWAASADWYPIDLSAGLSSTPPGDVVDRHGYSMQFSRARNELFIFGGYSSYHASNLEGVWRFDLSGGGTWTQLQNPTDPDLHPSARLSSSSEWVLVPTAAADLQKLLLFSGHGKGVGSSVPSPNDLWAFEMSDASTAGIAASWSKPEPFVCGAAGRAAQCPDSLSFTDLFPDLSVPLSQIIDQYSTHAPLVRPTDVSDYANALLVLQSQLSDMLNASKYTNYSSTHSSVDGACTDWCLQLDASSQASRPAPREGHGMSLLDWVNPATGVSLRQLVVFGGRLLDCPSSLSDTARGPDCYDPALYFLDLNTWTWSKRSPPLTAFLPGETKPADFWPARRAFHTQTIYHTPNGGAQLWLFAGHSYVREGLATFKSDLCMYDFAAQRWYLQPPNPQRYQWPQDSWRPADGSIDVLAQFGLGWLDTSPAPGGFQFEMHKDHMRAASWLVGDTWWMHGGCSTSTPTQELEPINDEHGTLWMLKIGAAVHADQLRVSNDDTKWLFGQGVTHAQLGPLYRPDGSLYRWNYFYFTVHQNLGTNLTGMPPAEQRRIRQFNDGLVGVPHTNSTAMPYWGQVLRWGTGLYLRLQVQLISHVVTGGDSDAGELISLFGIPGECPRETLNDALYMAKYSITDGSNYSVYISFDGTDVPGTPFTLNLETDLPSGWHSMPAAETRALPPIQYNAAGSILTQNYGNMDITRPPLWNGHGLSQVIRESSGSFLLQIVDIHLVPWNDNSNGVKYLNESVNSAVVFDAINVTLALFELGSGTALANLSLSDYNWINNNDGSYTVVYQPLWHLLSHLHEFELEVRVNDERIAQGASFVVSVTDLLAAPQSLVVAVTVVLVLMMALVLLIAFVVLREWPRQSLVSDALPMFVGCVVGALLLLITPLLMSPVSTSGCRSYPPLLSCGFMLMLGSLVSMYLKHAWLSFHIKQWAVTVQLNDQTSMTIERSLPALPGSWPRVSDWRICGWLCVAFALNVLLQCVWIGVAPLHVVRSPTQNRSPATLFDHCDTRSSAPLPKKVFVNFTLGVQAIVTVLALFFVSAVPVPTHPYSRRNWTRIAIFHLCLIAFLATVALKVTSEFDALESAFIVQTLSVIWSVAVTMACLLGPRVGRWWKARIAAERSPDEELRTWIEGFLTEQHALWAAKAALTHRNLSRKPKARSDSTQLEPREAWSGPKAAAHARSTFASPHSVVLILALALAPVSADSISSPDSTVSGRSEDLYRYASVFFFSIACLTLMTAFDVFLDSVQRSTAEDANGHPGDSDPSVRKRAGYRRFYFPSAVPPPLVLRKSFMFCTDRQYFALYCLNVCVSIGLVCLQVAATSFASNPYPSISLALFAVFLVMNITIIAVPPFPDQSIDTINSTCDLETRRKIIAEPGVAAAVALDAQGNAVTSGSSVVSPAQLALYSSPWLWVSLPRVYQLNILLAVPSFVAAAVSMASWNPSSVLAWITLGYQLWNCHSLLLLTLGGGVLLLPFMDEVEESCKRAAGGGTCYQLIGPASECVYEKINSWNSQNFEAEWIQPTHVKCTVGGRDMSNRRKRARSIARCRPEYSFRLLNSWETAADDADAISSAADLALGTPANEPLSPPSPSVVPHSPVESESVHEQKDQPALVATPLHRPVTSHDSVELELMPL